MFRISPYLWRKLSYHTWIKTIVLKAIGQYPDLSGNLGGTLLSVCDSILLSPSFWAFKPPFRTTCFSVFPTWCICALVPLLWCMLSNYSFFNKTTFFFFKTGLQYCSTPFPCSIIHTRAHSWLSSSRTHGECSPRNPQTLSDWLCLHTRCCEIIRSHVWKHCIHSGVIKKYFYRFVR